MASTRKAILTATFGQYVKDDPAALARFGGEDKIKQMVAASVKQANDAGFDISNIALNPKDLQDSIERLAATLKDKQWDGFLIGFGIRGGKEHTPLFEAAVNTAQEVAPRTRMLFGNAPDDLYNTLQRNFPDVACSVKQGGG
ncbi:hypothetical protein BAUCODRAFT_32921 [Baudoinia panamericana UAMH 10762]|uniref:Uncharacterized protein n=1 Tax=Baudoinia panamericana (strain UAMH 10762) TaxID=717646 RepID=M2LRT5_BAUPA|nr:uncharacterized protein BAUCODRAFT_32921 [Baudoinia panamericana UAMH 10762]EMC97182.1 hypothetical protein BAUCODRAFT_32921 [Baudoinia panamericana UAMH 10762]